MAGFYFYLPLNVLLYAIDFCLNNIFIWSNLYDSTLDDGVIILTLLKILDKLIGVYITNINLYLLYALQKKFKNRISVKSDEIYVGFFLDILIFGITLSRLCANTFWNDHVFKYKLKGYRKSIAAHSHSCYKKIC